MATWPTVTWHADWVHGPNAGTQTWTSLQSLGNTTVTAFKVGRGRQYELDLIESGTAEISVADLSEYLNPANTNSPWNSGGNTLDLYRQAQIQATWSGTTYNLFSGYIERYESEWDFSGFLGRRTLQCVDALALLNRRQYASVVRETILGYGPTMYIPLGDASGSTAAQSSDGSVTFPGGTAANPYFTSSSVPSLNFGTTSPAGAWDSTTWATFAPVGSGVTINSGKYLDLGNFGPSSSGAAGVYGATWSVSVAVQIPASVTTAGMFWSTSSITATNTTYIMSDPSLGVSAQIQTGAGATTFIGYGPTLYDGLPHVCTLVANGGSGISFYVDGSLIGTSATPANVPQGQHGWLGASVLGGGSNNNLYLSMNGSMAHVAFWEGTALTSTQVAAISNAIRNGFAGDTTDARVNRALGLAPWTGFGQTLDAGASTESAALWSGLTTKQILQQSAVTEGGAVWVDGAGKVRLSNRNDLRALGASVYTFGENVAGGEYPYLGDGNLLFSKDPTKIANQVTVTNANGTIGYTAVSASVTAYGPAGLAISTDFNDTTSPKQTADWYANLYSQAIQRVEKVVLDPASYNALWPVVLGLELFTVVTLTRRPSSGASVMTARYTVQRIEHDVDFSAGKWLTTLWLSPAVLQQALIPDDPVYGIVDSFPPSY